MRRISAFAIIGAVLAALAVQPVAAGATPRTARGSHHHRAAARPPRKRHHTASHHARRRQPRKTSGRMTTRKRAIRAETRKAHRLRLRAAAAALHEQLLEQISVLELQGATAGIWTGHLAGDTLRPAIRLTSTAPWLRRSSA
jgi:hypothetical protein